MSRELFTSDGQREYLNADELDRFIVAAGRHERSEVRSLCLVLAHTGCRISEALALTARSIDIEEQAITLQTLKQRGVVRYCSVPPPDIEFHRRTANQSGNL